MKITKKLLIIGLITLFFFLTEQKKIIQSDTFLTITSGENSSYEDDIYKDLRPRSFNHFKLI